jgi:drug/metabolite transporter (DMT)-like permease
MAFRHAVTAKMRTGVILAAAGLYFLCGGGEYQWNTGDLLGLLCALCYALHIVLTGRYAMQSDVYWLTAIELGMVGLLSMIFAKAGGHAILVRYDGMAKALVICVFFATIFAFLAQTAMQRYTTPTQTALIFCMEPVFAAASAYLVLEEKLGGMGLAGALLILVGMILSQLPDRRRA